MVAVPVAAEFDAFEAAAFAGDFAGPGRAAEVAAAACCCC